ncbi:uncharacterized protein LY89DRAFT_479382 [Mollisia scopiformis]|uniref:Heterokaryon incompatibility domain-containing protein n=1 Tax=Mollisia scopiformis TaxID=149040 RepID=A0A194XG83_MOLSC|nr:uncharacterized protein LY89DRAFT_479382 [Mollisia scopiformis]KUJ19178.1 hypothetical protein LY89DRAFT_479382 [Mollisia scopiformis]
MSAASAGVAKEEKALGSWPRRLLHVPTLTSYEWQPGIKYGKAVKPAYNILTYTWGRWKLADSPTKERPEVQGIPVKGIPWDIPRVHPARFTTQQFLEAIRQATMWWSIPGPDGSRVMEPEVEFVWVDVACLDQRKGEPTSDSERGRQVAIFSKAIRTFAWIGSIPSLQMERIHSAITDLTYDVLNGPKPSGYAPFRDHIENACQMLESFFSDPWFTSLWTLQETFLRVDAVFLSQEGLRVTRMGADDPSAKFEFGNLVHLDFRMREWDESLQDPAPQSWRTILDLMNKSGISAIGSGNFIAAYLAAKSRTAKRDEDRVYGIQQLFNLRLGNTAPGSAGTYWTRDQLEDQLAERLLVQHPVLSQMHVFTTPASFGTAWRLNQSSACPRLDFALLYNFSPGASSRRSDQQMAQGKVKPTCTFSTGKISGTTWCYFKGYMTPFRIFEQRCYEAEKSSTIRPVTLIMPPNVRKAFSFKIYLDASAEVVSCPDFLHGSEVDLNDIDYGISGLSNRRARPDKAARQQRLAQWLSSSFEPSQLMVLELLSLNNGVGEGPTRWYTYGLILLYQKRNDLGYFNRLGCCYWEDYSKNSRRKTYPADWSRCEGIVG